MSRLFLTFLALFCWATAAAIGLAAAEEKPALRFPSPDGRFAMRVQPMKEDPEQMAVDLVEKASGNVVGDLGTAYPRHLTGAVLAWSADAKWVAYGSRLEKAGETQVFHWNGTEFEEVPLPEELPDPEIRFSKAAKDGGVKNYGGRVKPLRWLKSGELELSNDLTLLSHVDGKAYTGVVRFTVGFDAQRHATVRKVGKTTTKVH